MRRPDPKTLEGVYAMLFAAGRSDRALDSWIACAFDLRLPHMERFGNQQLVPGKPGLVHLGEQGAGFVVENYSGSLDAALRLCERAMPASSLRLLGEATRWLLRSHLVATTDTLARYTLMRLCAALHEEQQQLPRVPAGPALTINPETDHGQPPPGAGAAPAEA